jgi:hypothetical protein
MITIFSRVFVNRERSEYETLCQVFKDPSIEVTKTASKQQEMKQVHHSHLHPPEQREKESKAKQKLSCFAASFRSDEQRERRL